MKRVTAQDIETARRAYVASIGTEHEAHHRQLLEWLVAKAKRDAMPRVS